MADINDDDDEALPPLAPVVLPEPKDAPAPNAPPPEVLSIWFFAAAGGLILLLGAVALVGYFSLR